MTVTPAELITRLLGVYEAKSLDELAWHLRIPLRTLQRWSSGDASPSWDKTIELLDRAGWLTTGADARDVEVRPEGIEDAVSSLLLGQAEGLEVLRRLETALLSAPAARTPAAPPKKAASQRRAR